MKHLHTSIPLPVLLLTLILTPRGTVAEGVRGGVLWYGSAPDSLTLATAARRFEMGITGPEHPDEKVAMRNLNPGFLWFMYNSGTDNYVPPHSPAPEHELIVSLSEARGVDPEEAYLHYVDDTRIVLEGDTVMIPGWGAGSALAAAEARVPVYSKTLVRRLLNFSTPSSHQLLKEVLISLGLDRPFSGTSLYPDGLFLDNSAYRLFNFGEVLEGGHVLEAPGQVSITSLAFQDWHWSQNLSPFLTALKDTLETSASWSADGRRKFLMINVSNIWDDSYVTRDVADYLFMEFQYNPVRAFGTGMVDEARRRDELAADAGITTFYAPTMTRSVLEKPEVYGYDEILRGNLVWYLVTRTAGSVLFELGTATPNAAGWDTLTWRGCLDVADTLLGAPLAPPYTLDQGTDPLGNPYVIKARDYEGGLVVLRNRGNWFEGIEPETAVPVVLPTSLLPVSPDGEVGDAVDRISLRNGEGALLLSRPVPVRLLSLTAERDAGGALIRWEAATSSGFAGFHVHRDTGDEPRHRVTSDPVGGGPGLREYRDPDPGPGRVRYWLSALSRAGGVEWFGPVVLQSAPGPRVSLSPPHPNPFRNGTRFGFRLSDAGPVRVRIVDVLGREVAVLLDEVRDAGTHEAAWHGRLSSGERAAPGLYFLVLEAPSGPRTRKVVLLP